MYHAYLRKIHILIKYVGLPTYYHFSFFLLFLFIYFYYNFFLFSKYDSQVKQNTSGCFRQIEMIISYVTKLIKLAKYPR